MFHTQALEFMFDHFSSGANMLLAIQFAEPGAEFVTRAGGLHVAQIGVQPIQARPTAFRRENFNLVASLQVVTQVYETSLNLRATTAMTNIGMDMIGEIN